MTMQMRFRWEILLTVFALLPWSSCVNNHVLLQVPFLRKSFLAVTTFVLCSFFMESVHMFAKSVRSVESLSTFFTCQHTTSACMNLKMPCKVCFFLNIFPHSSHFFSSCVWMLCWVNLDLDSNVFPHIVQTFSDIVLTWQRLEQNWRYMCQKKVRVVLLSKFSKQKLPSPKTVHFFTDIWLSLGGGVPPFQAFG